MKQSFFLVADSWHGADDLPEDQLTHEGVNEKLSDDVLIDVDGRRKNYVIGWYTFTYKRWMAHDSTPYELRSKHLKWSRLPLRKYDKGIWKKA